MRIIKDLVLIFLTCLLLGILVLLVLLKFPMNEPTGSASIFAPRMELKDKVPRVNISVLKTGYSKAPEAFVTRGGEIFTQRSMIHPGILVEHPRGTFLIDAGLGKDLQKELQKAPWLSRIMLSSIVLENPLIQHPQIENLKNQLDFIFITHGHWDHLSGTLDFPGVPIHMLPEEIRFLNQGKHPYRHGVFPHQVLAIKDRLVPIRLNETPYENFSRSLDWFGDGTVILVGLEGHTPGSLGIFLNKSPSERYLIVGDALWSVNSEGRPEPRSFLGEIFSDFDRDRARKTRRKLTELINHSNEILLVPMHDPNALKKLHNP